MSWLGAAYSRAVYRFLHWLSPTPDPWDIWDDDEEDF